MKAQTGERMSNGPAPAHSREVSKERPAITEVLKGIEVLALKKKKIDIFGALGSRSLSQDHSSSVEINYGCSL